MLEDPGLDLGELSDVLREAWAMSARDFTFVAGYDMQAASYAVTTGDAPVFLKVRFGPVAAGPLDVPRALLDAGVGHVLAPVRTLAGGLAHELADGRSLVLYPYLAGQSAMAIAMTAGQWRTFGTTLRAIHDSGLERTFAGRLRSEQFDLPASGSVRRALNVATQQAPSSPSRDRLAAVLRSRTSEIEATLERTHELGARLAGQRFQHVLCHADIHAANILVTDDGGIVLVDWDGPMLAPRERDLLFVIGSRIARRVEPNEEAWFFEGYGPVPVDREAIIYYRYERILEDIGEIGRTVFDAEDQPESSRAIEVDLLETFFEPGGILATAEQVHDLPWRP